MSIITAKGAEAKESAQKERLDTSKIYLRLADGDSHKVRILSPEDYVEYNAVGDFNNGIFNQPVAEDSPLLKAHKEGGEAFENLYPRKRYAFVFGSVETGELVAFDASRNQAKGLISTIEEYREDLEDVVFTFKRTGEKTSTTYTLNPKLKMTKDERKVFETFDDTEVELEFYEKILQPNDDAFVVKLLAEIDPDVVEIFPDIDITNNDEEDGDEEVVVENDDTPEDISDDSLPF